MLKAIHAQEDKEAEKPKAALVAEKLRNMKLDKVAEFIEKSVDETRSYMDFPYEHWSRLRTNSGLERIMKEIRRRTCVVVNFPDGYSAMMLVGVHLRHIVTPQWGTRQYMNTCKLYEDGVILRERLRLRKPTCSSGTFRSVGLLRLRQVTFDFYNQSETNVRKIPDTTIPVIGWQEISPLPSLVFSFLLRKNRKCHSKLFVKEMKVRGKRKKLFKKSFFAFPESLLDFFTKFGTIPNC